MPANGTGGSWRMHCDGRPEWHSQTLTEVPHPPLSAALWSQCRCVLLRYKQCCRLRRARWNTTCDPFCESGERCSAMIWMTSGVTSITKTKKLADLGLHVLTSCEPFYAASYKESVKHAASKKERGSTLSCCLERTVTRLGHFVYEHGKW
jgi:hypothetical protein